MHARKQLNRWAEMKNTDSVTKYRANKNPNQYR
jgi:hypothetical protein